MADDRLRVGVIGVGMIALIGRIPDLRSTGKMELVAICRRNPDMLRKAQEFLQVPEAYTDWRKMLDKVELDAIAVSTPHHVHYEQTRAALDHGLHVLLEKTMALTTEEAWDLVQAADRADRVLMIVSSPRFDGPWRTVTRVLAEGIIGTVRQVTATLSYPRWWFQTILGPEELRETSRHIIVPIVIH